MNKQDPERESFSADTEYYMLCLGLLGLALLLYQAGVYLWNGEWNSMPLYVITKLIPIKDFQEWLINPNILIGFHKISVSTFRFLSIPGTLFMIFFSFCFYDMFHNRLKSP